MRPVDVLMGTLVRALSFKRPHGSREEGELLAWLAQQSSGHEPWVDTAGNLHVDLRYLAEPQSTTLFVAHVDTVHHIGGANRFDRSTSLWKADGVEPLGADDGAGVAMLNAMIYARKPGYYIFTRGEERGGVGSKYLAQEHDQLLAEFDRAIAFDRRDVISVITHQGFGGRCCSDEFGNALSDALNAEGLITMPDETGIYTDTAEFVDIIPECTNISAGYYSEHTAKECLDTVYLKDLFAAALAMDWEALPTVRNPDSYEPVSYKWDRWNETEKAINDPFVWEDDRGVPRTGSGRRKSSTKTIAYREHTITINSDSEFDHSFYVMTEGGDEVDWGYGYISSADAELEARAAVDSLLIN